LVQLGLTLRGAFDFFLRIMNVNTHVYVVIVD